MAAPDDPPVARAPKGTHDVLAPESTRWEGAVASFARRAEQAGYGLVLSPLYEDVRVFHRGFGGAEAEVVTKEMFEFEDRGGRRLALRPEGTASVVRAFVQHHPTTPWKAWYVTPAFRDEREQELRFKQHHQLGVEVLGSEDPDLDVEVIALAQGFLAEQGLTRVQLLLGSMGDGTCRPPYVARLRQILAGRAATLCDEHRERWERNPLRVLDCKKPECRAATADVPGLVDELCDPCQAHFDRVREGLEALSVPYEVSGRLVRGFDYYTRTTFEFAGLALAAAQNGVGGGGRYGGLAEALGGPPTPGIGFGLGLERLFGALDAEGRFGPPAPHLDVFVVDVTDGRAARDLTAELRAAGLSADRAFDGRSMKAQLKLADRRGARWAAIVGPAEAEAGQVTLRDLRGHPGQEGSQEAVPRQTLVARLTKEGR